MGAALLYVKKPGEVTMLTPRPHLGPEVFQVRAGYLLGYRKNVVFEGRSRPKVITTSTKPNAAGFGASARKRMTRALDLFFLLCEPKWIYNPITHRRHQHTATLITLTIPDGRKVERKWANRYLLNRFLVWLKGHGGIYIWKAEYTRKGQVHYHIIYSRFIEHGKVRQIWNKALRDARLLDKYAKQHGHYNAPSTETKGIITHKDLAAYLRKYIKKGVDAEKGGRCWGCSEALEKIKPCELDEAYMGDFITDRTALIYDEFCIVPDVQVKDMPPEAQIKFIAWKSNATAIVQP